MRNLDELGIRPRRRNAFAPATGQAIADFEARFGVQLPPEYVAMLKSYNGGRAVLRMYDDPRGGTGEISWFYGLGSPNVTTDGASWDYENLWSETQVRRPWIGEHGVPIESDGGDNQLYLDYTREPPAVSRLNASTRTSAILFPTFADFIDALRPIDDE